MDNLEKTQVESILGLFLNSEETKHYMEQLNKPLGAIADKWIAFLPESVSQKWDKLSVVERSEFQVPCLKISDLETVAQDYRDQFLSDG